MNGMNGKKSDFPDVALVPYPVIVAATKGDPDAMKIILQHFSGYIASLSMEIASWRTLCMARRKKDVPGLPCTASPLSCVAFFVKEHTGLLRIDTKRKRG